MLDAQIARLSLEWACSLTDIDLIYTSIQDVFRRGLVIVVGSGASSALGLPSMGALAEHLLSDVPARLLGEHSEARREWNEIATRLENGRALESAIADTAVSEGLAEILAESVAQCVLAAEQGAIADLVMSGSVPPLGRLLLHLLETSAVVDVVTTNYDRLIEVQAARASVRVDTMFYGHTVGRFDAALSRDELLIVQTVAGRSLSTRIRARPHIRLAKPHGSLDWFSLRGEHFRSDLALSGARRIIAPGGNKYRQGYEIPFDAQRARANEAIDSAASLLFIGYGFNDDHLQTHIRARIPHVPTLVTSRSLTVSALEHLALNESAIGIEAGSQGAGSSVRIGSTISELTDDLWDLDHLLKEVLKL